MKTITESEFSRKHPDFTGYFENLQNDPKMEHLKGKRTMLEWNDKLGTCLIFEDVHFKVIPDWVKKIAVTDCKTVEEFAYKYRKPDRFTGRGKNYEKSIIRSHHKDLKDHGYTTISHHDNVTGKHIAYIPTN